MLQDQILIDKLKELTLKEKISALATESTTYRIPDDFDKINTSNVLNIIWGSYYAAKPNLKDYQHKIYPFLLPYIKVESIYEMENILKRYEPQEECLDGFHIISFLTLNKYILSSYSEEKHDFLYALKSICKPKLFEQIKKLFFKDAGSLEDEYQVKLVDNLYYSFDKAMLRLYHSTESDIGFLSAKARDFFSVLGTKNHDKLKIEKTIVDLTDNKKIDLVFVNPKDKSLIHHLMESFFNHFNEIDNNFLKNNLSTFIDKVVLEYQLKNNHNYSMKLKI